MAPQQTNTPLARVQAIKSYLDAPGATKALSEALRSTDMTPTQMKRIALTQIWNNESLMRCTAESILSSMLQCANYGFEPGPSGLAYFVPYGDQCTFMLGWRGLIQLAYRSGQVLVIEPHLVYERDDFSIDFGQRPPIRHRPTPAENRGDIVGAWVYAEVVQSGVKGALYHHMWAHEIYANHRAKSKTWRRAEESGKRNSTWHTDLGAMVRKSIVKSAFPLLPMSIETLSAVARDDELEGVTPGSTPLPESIVNVANVVNDEEPRQGAKYVENTNTSGGNPQETAGRGQQAEPHIEGSRSEVEES